MKSPPEYARIAAPRTTGAYGQSAASRSRAVKSAIYATHCVQGERSGIVLRVNDECAESARDLLAQARVWQMRGLCGARNPHVSTPYTPVLAQRRVLRTVSADALFATDRDQALSEGRALSLVQERSWIEVFVLACNCSGYSSPQVDRETVEAFRLCRDGAMHRVVDA